MTICLFTYKNKIECVIFVLFCYDYHRVYTTFQLAKELVDFRYLENFVQ